ncbi:MAG TPA: IclR family transcriptional regulator [Ramlibacter sp.]|nr:IclR family transcriptional regulator [Ramlibacter sp.]
MSPDRYLRTFDVLDLLVRHKEGLRLTEIKDALSLPVSSVHNMLQTMVSADVASVDSELRYSVGPRAVALALRTVQSLDIRSLARRPLQELAKAIGDDVYLGLRLGKRVIYADRILGTQRISLDIRLGEPLFLHSTATGKLFAAYDERLAAQVLADRLLKLTAHTITDPKELEREYQRIRAAGFAKSHEESMEGVVGYAIPIRDASDQLAAAVHASVLTSRATKAHERKILASARECAQQIEKLLGHAPLASSSSRQAKAVRAATVEVS